MFGNIIKYIKMAASSNFGNMFSVLGASAFLPFLPMAPVQVLINNLLYDFSQTAIATDNVDAEYLAKPRHWDIGNISASCSSSARSARSSTTRPSALMLFVFDAGRTRRCSRPAGSSSRCCRRR